MNQKSTLKDDILALNELRLLIPIGGVIFSGFWILFGYIYQRTYYSHFAINVLDYMPYKDFLGIPFREPRTAVSAAISAFVAIISLRIAFSEDYKDRSILFQLREVLIPFVILYVVYSMITGSADMAASTLPNVSIEFQTSSKDEIKTEEYLMIGRIGDTLFFCDSDVMKIIILSESEIIKTSILTGESRDAEDCWKDVDD